MKHDPLENITFAYCSICGHLMEKSQREKSCKSAWLGKRTLGYNTGSKQKLATIILRKLLTQREMRKNEPVSLNSMESHSNGSQDRMASTLGLCGRMARYESEGQELIAGRMLGGRHFSGA
jgi:hypothetical protein